MYIKLEVIRIKRYFMLAGGVIVVLTIVISLLSSLYSEYFFCKGKINDSIEEQKDKPHLEASMTEAQMREYLDDLETRVRCSTVDGNIFTSYLAIIVGLSLLVCGFIIRD